MKQPTSEIANEGILSLSGALRLVRELFRLEVERMRAAGIAVGEDEFRGLYTSDGEADRLLDDEPDASPSAGAAGIRDELDRFARTDTGRFGRLVRLAAPDRFESGALLLCLASEVDLGMERLVGYVQDDVTKRRPRVDLALRLLGDPNGAASAAFDPGSRLLRWRLITLHDEPGNHTRRYARATSPSIRVVAYLEERDGVDDALLIHGRVLDGGDGLAIGMDTNERVAALAALPAQRRLCHRSSQCRTDIAALRAAAATVAAGAVWRSSACVSRRWRPMEGSKQG